MKLKFKAIPFMDLPQGSKPMLDLRAEPTYLKARNLEEAQKKMGPNYFVERDFSKRR